MALALPTDGALSISVPFEDETRTLPRTYTCEWDTDLITTITKLIDMANDAAELSDAAVRRATIAVTVTDDAAVVPQVAGMGDVVALSIPLDDAQGGSSEFGITSVPAPKLTIMNGTTKPGINQLNGSNADVVAFVNRFKAAGGFVISDGQHAKDDAVANGKRRPAKGKYVTN